MVVHREYDTAFAEWRDLLAACDVYASLSGWRFIMADFMRLHGRQESDALREARERAMPMALEYADRVRACAAACASGAPPPRLVSEFEACQRLVAAEAVYNSMVATVTAVGLGGDGGGGGGSGGDGSGWAVGGGVQMQPQLGGGGEQQPPPPPPEAGADAEAEAEAEADAEADAEVDAEAFAYHDMSQPIEIIARRLRAYHARMQATPALRDERQRRLLHASFVVEFGLEHGLPEKADPTSEATLTDFLARLAEWEGGQNNDVVRALVLDSISPGPAQRSLKNAATQWFEEHKGATTIIGGAIIGGMIGVAVASAALAIASSRGGRR